MGLTLEQVKSLLWQHVRADIAINDQPVGAQYYLDSLDEPNQFLRLSWDKNQKRTTYNLPLAEISHLHSESEWQRIKHMFGEG